MGRSRSNQFHYQVNRGGPLTDPPTVHGQVNKKVNNRPFYFFYLEMEKERISWTATGLSENK